VKQGLPCLLWVKSDKGLRPAHLSNEGTSGKTSKNVHFTRTVSENMSGKETCAFL